MDFFGAGKRSFLSAVMLLIASAFLLQAVLPTGFMPSAKGGFMELVICSGMGEKTILVPSDQGTPANHENDTAKEFCAYQFLASGKTLIPAQPAVLLSPDLYKVVEQVGRDSFTASAYRISFAARGPPSA